MRKRSFQYGDESFQSTFAGIIRDKDWEQKFDQHRVFLKWREIVDPETASCSRPQKVVRDVLWVEVDNSAWVQQLQFKKLELLDSLNDYLRVSHFSDIRFSVREKQTAESGGQEPPRRLVPPSAADIEQFEKQIDFIEDEEIKQAMTRLWYISQAVRKD